MHCIIFGEGLVRGGAKVLLERGGEHIVVVINWGIFIKPKG